MTFDKLDKTREQAVVTAIEKIIDRSRHEPDESLSKIAADVLGATDDMTPELARRACEAFNKSKSVFTLQKRASEDRAEEFELIDAEEVHRLMYGYHQKAASLLMMPARSHSDNIPELREKLKKVALDASVAPEPISIGVLEREIHRTSIRLEHSVNKLRERVGMHKQASEDAIHRTCQVMRRLPRRQIKKIAHLVVNRYGDDGVRFIKMVGAFIEKELPIEKTAAAAIFPLREPFPSIAIAIDQARSFSQTKNMLTKTADVGDVASGGYGGVKSALSGVRRLLDPVVRFAKSPVYQQVTKEHNKEDDEAFDATLRNQLQQLRATQSFVDVASDDFVKGYELDDTMQAFNNVVGTMPDLLDEKYGPWLKALVREQLVQGNVYDANTIKQLQEIGKEIAKGRITDVDMATKALEAGKGGTLPGLEIPEAPKEAPKKQTVAKKDDKGDRQTKAQELDLKERALTQKTESERGQLSATNRQINLAENREARAREAAERRQA